MKLDTNAFFKGPKKMNKINGDVEMLKKNNLYCNNLPTRNSQVVLSNGKVKDDKLSNKTKTIKNKKDTVDKSDKKVVILNEKEVKQLWFSAVKSRNLKMVASLLAQEIELICFKDKFGYTALHYAIEADDCEMFEKLILSIKTYAQKKQKHEQQKQKQSSQKIKQTNQKESDPQLQTAEQLQVKNNLVEKNHQLFKVCYLEKEFHKLHVSQNEQPLSQAQFSLTQAQKNEWILNQQQKQQELQKQQLQQQQFKKELQQSHETYRDTCFTCTNACFQCQLHPHQPSHFVGSTKSQFPNDFPLYPLSSEASHRNSASINNMQQNYESVQSTYLASYQPCQQMRNSIQLNQTATQHESLYPKQAIFSQPQIVTYPPKGFDQCPCHQQPKCCSSAYYQVFASPPQLSSSSTSLPLNILPPFPLPPSPPSISSLSSPSLINANAMK